MFHLLQTVSSNTIDLDVGVPARGLHGGTRYTVHLGDQIVDNGGNLLPASQREFTFIARR